MNKSPILVMTIDQDPNTTEVIRWLKRYGECPVRINKENQTVSLAAAEDGHIALEIDGEEVSLQDVKAYWYRRGNWADNLPELKSNHEQLEETAGKYLKHEKDALQEYLHFKLKGIHHLSDYPAATGINKNIVLDTARSCGLAVPPTLITGLKSKVKAFREKHAEVVTKPLRTSIRFYTQNHWLPMYTEEVTDEVMDQLPEQFAPSLFQKKITKRYEVRTFFLEEEYYSMAIFSQKDKQTATDFRKYNHEKPNRNVPVMLPDEVQERLKILMNKLELNTGSADLLATPQGEYYFLEVNPIGQFGMTSYPCNYFLERRVAQYLKDGK